VTKVIKNKQLHQ